MADDSPRPLPAATLVAEHKTWSAPLRWVARMAREGANWFLFVAAAGSLLGILAKHLTACAAECSEWADKNVESTRRAAGSVPPGTPTLVHDASKEA